MSATSAPVDARAHGGKRREFTALFATALHVVRTGGWQLAALYLACQVLVGIIAAPVLQWLFDEALRAAGLTGLEGAGIPRLIETPLSVGLILTLVLLAFTVLSVQFLVIVTAVRRVRAGERLFSREWARELSALARKLARPSSVALLPYLFLLLPLGGFGFFSVLSKGIVVPSFISGEIVKTVPGIVGYLAFLIVLLVMNTRLALTVPLFAMTDATGGRALRQSRRATRGRAVALALSIFAVTAAGFLAGGLLVLIGLLPVMFADAVLPAVAPVLAAIMLAVVEVGGMIVVGVGVVIVVALLVEIAEPTRSEVAAEPGAAEPGAAEPVAAEPVGARRRRPSGRGSLVPVTALCVLLVVLAAINVPAMQAISSAPQTLVLAHRGYTAEAVENTISSLRAARDAGVDLVEMDVMETADGEFVAMHDATLGRLADMSVSVAELTLEELTAITVHNLAGDADHIPSLADYVSVAHEIGQPLLIEIKLHGGEHPDLVPRLVAELESLEVLEENIYHSLDAPSVEELKRLRPGLTVGYTMAVAGTGAPQTSADFLVVEEWSYNDELLQSARHAGLGMMVWTVNDDQRIRDLMRSDVDGIVTDHAESAVRARDEMQRSNGMSDVLFDAIMRYVVIF